MAKKAKKKTSSKTGSKKGQRPANKQPAKVSDDTDLSYLLELAAKPSTDSFFSEGHGNSLYKTDSDEFHDIFQEQSDWDLLKTTKFLYSILKGNPLEFFKTLNIPTKTKAAVYALVFLNLPFRTLTRPVGHGEAVVTNWTFDANITSNLRSLFDLVTSNATPLDLRTEALLYWTFSHDRSDLNIKDRAKLKTDIQNLVDTVDIDSNKFDLKDYVVRYISRLSTSESEQNTIDKTTDLILPYDVRMTTLISCMKLFMGSNSNITVDKYEISLDSINNAKNEFRTNYDRVQNQYLKNRLSMLTFEKVPIFDYVYWIPLHVFANANEKIPRLNRPNTSTLMKTFNPSIDTRAILFFVASTIEKLLPNIFDLSEYGSLMGKSPPIETPSTLFAAETIRSPYHDIETNRAKYVKNYANATTIKDSFLPILTGGSSELDYEYDKMNGLVTIPDFDIFKSYYIEDYCYDKASKQSLRKKNSVESFPYHISFFTGSKVGNKKFFCKLNLEPLANDSFGARVLYLLLKNSHCPQDLTSLRDIQNYFQKIKDTYQENVQLQEIIFNMFGEITRAAEGLHYPVSSELDANMKFLFDYTPCLQLNYAIEHGDPHHMKSSLSAMICNYRYTKKSMYFRSQSPEVETVRSCCFNRIISFYLLLSECKKSDSEYVARCMSCSLDGKTLTPIKHLKLGERLHNLARFYFIPHLSKTHTRVETEPLIKQWMDNAMYAFVSNPGKFMELLNQFSLLEPTLKSGMFYSTTGVATLALKMHRMRLNRTSNYISEYSLV